MNEENNTPVSADQDESDRSDTRRSVLKGAAAIAAAAVAATTSREAEAAPSWPCQSQLNGPHGTMTLEDSRGRLYVRVVLEGISKEAAQEICFSTPTPQRLAGINIKGQRFDAWSQDTLLCW